MAESSTLSRLRRGTIEAIVLQGGGMGMLLVMNTVVGRAVGVEGYGRFSYALAVAGILAPIASLGLPQALLRFIPQYVEQERWSLVRGVLKRGYQLTFLCSAVMAVLLWGISYLSVVPSDLSVSLRFAAVLVLPLAFVLLRSKALRGLQHIIASIVPDQIVVPLLVISAALLFSLSVSSDVLLAYAMAAFVAFAMGSLWLWRSMPQQARVVKPEFESRHWIAVALPMMVVGLSQIVMNRTDVIMLGALSSVEAVGLYGAANRIAYVIIFVMTAVNVMCAPLISAAYHGGRTQDFKTVRNKAMIWSAIGSLPLFVIIMIWAPEILAVFGPEFDEGAALLRVLAVGYFFNAVTGPIGAILLMTGRERMFAVTTLIMLGVNVAGNLVMIPTFGALGAAVVTTTSFIVLYGWRFWIAREAVRALP